MDALLYASLSRQILSETLGGGKFGFPPCVAGGSAHLGLRWTHRRDGKESVRELDLIDVVAAIGSLDSRPATGTTRIKLGLSAQTNGANTTAALDVEDLTADGIVAALAALSQVGGVGDPYPAPTATDDDGTILLIFPGATAPVEINLADNELDPISLLRVVTWEAGGEIVHALRFMQTPAALSRGFEQRVPTGPSIVRHQAGGDVDGDKRTEIQILVRPPEFNGVFQIVRNSIRSGLLSRADGVAQIKAAIDPLADAKGFFEVTNPKTGEAFIAFRGSMDHTGHDLLGIHVARAPLPDAWIKLDFDHPEFSGLLAAKDNVVCPLHIRATYRDEIDEDVVHTADWIVDVTAKRGLHWEGLAAGAKIDYLRPPATSYVPSAVGAIITGNQHLVAAFPTSGDVGASAFTFTHDLDSEDGHVAVRVNSTPGALLVHGRDYEVEFTNADQLEISLLSGGHFGTPVVPPGTPTKFKLANGDLVDALGYLSLTYTTAGPRSALLNHTQAIGSIDELPETLEDFASRLLSIEGRLATGSARTATTSGLGGAFGTWTPDPVEIVYPLSRRRRAAITTWPKNLRDLLGIKYRGRPLLRGKSGSLLPAVHDAAEENISSLSPAFPALGNYVGRVFENNTAGPLTIAGKGGRPGIDVPVGGFLACNGKAWYAVEKQEARAGDNPFTSSGYSSSSSEPAWTVTESTWYPTQFRHELFCFPVGKDVLTDGRTFHFPFAFEAALLAANTKAQAVLWVRFGRRTSATSPGTPGENLEAIEWRDPSLVQRIDLGGQPSAHSFAIRVTREADDESERGYSLACEVEKYGTSEVSHPPLDAEFWIQGEILNFDTLDAPASPEGFLCLSGLKMPAEYDIAAPSEGTVGTAAVSE